jgi:hypothetical protein
MASAEFSTAINEASFHSWSEMPQEIQLEVWSHVVTEPEPIMYKTNRKQQMHGTGISNIISTRSRHLVDLALDACKSLDDSYCKATY